MCTPGRKRGHPDRRFRAPISCLGRRIRRHYTLLVQVDDVEEKPGDGDGTADEEKAPESAALSESFEGPTSSELYGRMSEFGYDDEELPPSTIGTPSTAQLPSAAPSILLEPRGDRPEPLVFRHGAHPPYAIRWYGITSLFGHLRNFVARAIATESVDSRDWMRPNAPQELLSATVNVLHGGRAQAPSFGAMPSLDAPTSLVEALGRPVWIDFIADTGDDRDVSAGVGAMLTSTYDVPDEHGETRHLPRGDVLVFGGDIAYPVATADEIYKRLVAPWNEKLRRALASSRKRVVLGVPGNHDWYDGLDGFGRLFRRHADEPFRADHRDSTPKLGKHLRRRSGRNVGLVARQLHLDEVGGAYGLVMSFVRSVRAFLRGVPVKRRRRLSLRGYEPVQEASYFALPLAQGLDLFGADRQLGSVDFRQRTFFSRWRKAHPERAVLFVAGDPATAYGMPNEPGIRMLAACRLRLEHDRIFYIAGDFHHYERRKVGSSMHVIAGGGGAFLHGTRISPYPAKSGPPEAVYPTGAQSRRLALQVPIRLAFFRAGGLVHLALALIASIELTAARTTDATLTGTSVIVAIGLVVGLYFIAHQGKGKARIAALALPFGTVLGLLPTLLRRSVSHWPSMAVDWAVLAVSAFGGAFLFGLYLTVLSLLGLEHQQSFTVLGHPGFKHFVRLCVHPDGKIEAWTIGKDDVLAEKPPMLIDRFSWRYKDEPEPASTEEVPEIGQRTTLVSVRPAPPETR